MYEKLIEKLESVIDSAYNELDWEEYDQFLEEAFEQVSNAQEESEEAQEDEENEEDDDED